MIDSRVLMFLCPTKLYIGIGALEDLKGIVSEYGLRGLYVLVDPAIMKAPLFELIQCELQEAGILFDVFSEIEPDPSVGTVEKAYERYQGKKAEGLFAVGGGSTIDVAKAVAILATNAGRIQDYEGIDKFSNAPLPLVALPTTAGTGSEVSGSCVITDTERDLKLSIRSATMNPATAAILDPTALQTLPAEPAIHSAMDAFVHALESYLSLNANPITDALNLYAIELISQNIRPFVSKREDLEVGLKMLCASSLGAIGFTHTGAGNIHCMARFVGAIFHLSHGLSNAVCLPHGAEFNLTANPEKFARVAQAMGENVHDLSAVDAGKEAIGAIKRLSRDMGIPERLRDVGVTADKIPEMARLAYRADYNRWNPRYTSEEDFLELFKKAY